jgi:hypothetical protein
MRIQVYFETQLTDPTRVPIEKLAHVRYFLYHFQ